MSKPTVSSSTVPVLHVGGNVDNSAGQNLHSGFPLFLIPSSAGNTHEHLSTSFRGLVDMPVVAASRLKSHIGKGYLPGRYGRQIAVAGKILGVSRIGLAYRENHASGELGLGIVALDVVGPYVFGQTESRPGLGPSGVESHVGNYLSCLCAGYAVGFGILQMMQQRTVGDSLGNERSHSNHTAVAK